MHFDKLIRPTVGADLSAFDGCSDIPLNLLMSIIALCPGAKGSSISRKSGKKKNPLRDENAAFGVTHESEQFDED